MAIATFMHYLLLWINYIANHFINSIQRKSCSLELLQLQVWMFSLYLDHQKLAPLVRLLQNSVEEWRSEIDSQLQTYELRLAIYQEFISIIHNSYIENHPEIKNEEGHQVKLQPLLEMSGSAHIEDLLQMIEAKKETNRRVRGPSNKSLEVELNLVQWIRACDKRIFEKREIDMKYQELMGDSKRSISLKKIGEIVEKYNISALIVRARNKQEHFFGRGDSSQSTLQVKKQQCLDVSQWMEEQTLKKEDRNADIIKEEQFQDEDHENNLEKTLKNVSSSRSRLKVFAEESYEGHYIENCINDI